MRFCDDSNTNVMKLSLLSGLVRQIITVYVCTSKQSYENEYKMNFCGLLALLTLSTCRPAFLFSFMFEGGGGGGEGDSSAPLLFLPSGV